MSLILVTKRKIYLISDTHWFHDEMSKSHSRPENFMDLTLMWWKNTIKETDIVFHLGDVILYRYNILKDILDQLPGEKILVRGNHDKKSNHWYMNNGFSFSCELFAQGDILFTHERVKLGRNSPFNLNIHGHTHTNVYDFIQNFSSDQELYHRLFSLEFEQYKPVNLEKFINKTKTASYYYGKLKEFSTNGKK